MANHPSRVSLVARTGSAPSSFHVTMLLPATAATCTCSATSPPQTASNQRDEGYRCCVSSLPDRRRRCNKRRAHLANRQACRQGNDVPDHSHRSLCCYFFHACVIIQRRMGGRHNSTWSHHTRPTIYGAAEMAPDKDTEQLQGAAHHKPNTMVSGWLNGSVNQGKSAVVTVELRGTPVDRARTI